MIGVQLEQDYERVEDGKRKLAEGKTDTSHTVSKISKISVRPATAENTRGLEDVTNADGLQAESNKISAPVFKEQGNQTTGYRDEDNKRKQNVLQPENRREQEYERTTKDQHRLLPVLPSPFEWMETTSIGRKVKDGKRKLAEGKTNIPHTIIKIPKISVRPATAENTRGLGERLQAKSNKISAPVFKEQGTQTTSLKQRLCDWFRKKFSHFCNIWR